MAALRNTNKKIDIAKELKVVDLTAGGKVQPYVKGLQVENELNKVSTPSRSSHEKCVFSKSSDFIIR